MPLIMTVAKKPCFFCDESLKLHYTLQSFLVARSEAQRLQYVDFQIRIKCGFIRLNVGFAPFQMTMQLCNLYIWEHTYHSWSCPRLIFTNSSSAKRQKPTFWTKSISLHRRQISSRPSQSRIFDRNRLPVPNGRVPYFQDSVATSICENVRFSS